MRFHLRIFGELRFDYLLERRTEYPDDKVVDVLEIIVERLTLASDGVRDVDDAHTMIARRFRDQVHERVGEFLPSGTFDTHAITPCEGHRVQFGFRDWLVRPL